jgi:hypothetical protein
MSVLRRIGFGETAAVLFFPILTSEVVDVWD